MAKSEIRRHRVARYTAVPQAMLEDSELSEKEVGIYARILALPEYKKSGEPFDFSVEGYCMKYHGDSRRGCKLIYSGLNALGEAGWIVRTQQKGDDGRWGKVIYDLLPQKEKPLAEKRNAEKGDAVEWNAEKGEQINIDKTNTEENSSTSATREELLFEEMRYHSPMFNEDMMRLFKLTEENLQKKYEEYWLYNRSCHEWDNLNDMKQHFRNWLMRRNENETISKGHDIHGRASNKSLEVGTNFNTGLAD